MTSRSVNWRSEHTEQGHHQAEEGFQPSQCCPLAALPNQELPVLPGPSQHRTCTASSLVGTRMMACVPSARVIRGMWAWSTWGNRNSSILMGNNVAAIQLLAATDGEARALVGPVDPEMERQLTQEAKNQALLIKGEREGRTKVPS